MARTIFVTKQYVNGQLTTETNARVTADKAIDDNIALQAGKIDVNTTNIATINSKITTETAQRQSQVGNMAFNSNLKNADSSAVTNLTEAVNATVLLKNEIETAISGVDVSGYQALQNSIAGLVTKVNQDNARINAILSGSTADFDSFAEIVTLVTTKNAETAADLATLKAELEAELATKMSKVQTSTSSLEYIDANDSSKKYRIVIVDGQLAVEDII